MHRFDDETLQSLYRFRPLNDDALKWAERTFTEGELYFSSPDQLNDPSELRPAFTCSGSAEEILALVERLCTKYFPHLGGESRKAQIRRMIDALAEQNNRYEEKLSPEAEALWERERKSVGICCFSEDWSSPAMWAHYASEHRGFCIEFEATSHTPFFGLAQRVTYGDEYPKINILSSSRIQDMERAMLWKSKQWERESEWRIVDTDGGPGVKKFPVHLIRSIFIGERTKPEHEAIIRGWASNIDTSLPVRRVTSVPGSFQMVVA